MYFCLELIYHAYDGVNATHLYSFKSLIPNCLPEQ